MVPVIPAGPRPEGGAPGGEGEAAPGDAAAGGAAGDPLVCLLGPHPAPFLEHPPKDSSLLRATAAYHEARKTRTMGFHSIDPNPKTDQIDEGVFCFNRLPAFDWGNNPS